MSFQHRDIITASLDHHTVNVEGMLWIYKDLAFVLHNNPLARGTMPPDAPEEYRFGWKVGRISKTGSLPEIALRYRFQLVCNKPRDP